MIRSRLSALAAVLAVATVLALAPGVAHAATRRPTEAAAAATRAGTVLSGPRARRHDPSAGRRIVTIARRYVGRARYVEGGASPKRGFDCSGYTKYVYARARVRRLPHNAERQRRMPGMRRIPARRARPGDLVFYLRGGHAYHVAIFAGHRMQYAAATPGDGIRHQPVWSRAVQYRTLTH